MVSLDTVFLENESFLMYFRLRARVRPRAYHLALHGTCAKSGACAMERHMVRTWPQTPRCVHVHAHAHDMCFFHGGFPWIFRFHAPSRMIYA